MIQGLNTFLGGRAVSPPSPEDGKYGHQWHWAGLNRLILDHRVLYQLMIEEALVCSRPIEVKEEGLWRF